MNPLLKALAALETTNNNGSLTEMMSLKWVHQIENAIQSPIRKQTRAIFPGWIELEEEDKLTLLC
jgi:hypothetical protein